MKDKDGMPQLGLSFDGSKPDTSPIFDKTGRKPEPVEPPEVDKRFVDFILALMYEIRASQAKSIFPDFDSGLYVWSLYLHNLREAIKNRWPGVARIIGDFHSLEPMKPISDKLEKHAWHLQGLGLTVPHGGIHIRFTCQHLPDGTEDILAVKGNEGLIQIAFREAKSVNEFFPKELPVYEPTPGPEQEGPSDRVRSNLYGQYPGGYAVWPNKKRGPLKR